MGDRNHSSMPVHTGVDVQQAEKDFTEMSRQLSRTGTNSARTSTVNGVNSDGSNDLEKGASNEQGAAFDLREYLSASNDANHAAGLKHKVILQNSCDTTH